MIVESPLALDDAPEPRRSRWWLVALLTLLGLLVMAAAAGAYLLRAGRPLMSSPFIADSTGYGFDQGPQELRRRAIAAEKELDQVAPKSVWIVIDTYRNRLHVVEDGNVIRSAVCSTGTGRVLKDPRSDKRIWVFDTPMGERTISNKRKNPVWAKPDWAFIEEGYLPPPAGSPERFDDVSLGDFGLYMGSDGYIIHGTLFKSLLGRRVTHGCVRLGDEDLEFVYKRTPIGTHVYLY